MLCSSFSISMVGSYCNAMPFQKSESSLIDPLMNLSLSSWPSKSVSRRDRRTHSISCKDWQIEAREQAADASSRDRGREKGRGN